MTAIYWVYILLCDNGAYYTGYTNHLEKRYQAHCEGKASKYTRSFKPVKIAQAWQVPEKSLAMRIERTIKMMTRAEKEEIILQPDKIHTLTSRK